MESFFLKITKCKSWKGKQAVVVLQCENGHMPTDMISDPGIVMIFAHGVEDVWMKLKIYLPTPFKTTTHMYQPTQTGKETSDRLPNGKMDFISSVT